MPMERKRGEENIALFKQTTWLSTPLCKSVPQVLNARKSEKLVASMPKAME